MNRKQRMCLWAGIAVFVLMGLFPPWYYGTAPGPQSPTFYWHAYSPLWFPPDQLYRLDIQRLFVQWAMLGAVATGLMLTFSDRT